MHTGKLSDRYPWVVDTDVGEYILKFRGDVVDDYSGAIFGRFREPERASKVVHCNQYSGKWNFHFDKCTAEQAWQEFTCNVGKVMRGGR